MATAPKASTATPCGHAKEASVPMPSDFPTDPDRTYIAAHTQPSRHILGATLPAIVETDPEITSSRRIA